LPKKYFRRKNIFTKKYFSQKKFVRATTNKFGPKVLKLKPKAAFNSPPQDLEEGAHSAPYLLVNTKINRKLYLNNIKLDVPSVSAWVSE
jgi:hypothetical protein